MNEITELYNEHKANNTGELAAAILVLAEVIKNKRTEFDYVSVCQIIDTIRNLSSE